MRNSVSKAIARHPAGIALSQTMVEKCDCAELSTKGDSEALRRNHF
ncbi:MAG: hypothetical protein ACK53Q_12600 [Dolichospermum sp.]